jgi:hypothetical protein
MHLAIMATGALFIPEVSAEALLQTLQQVLYIYSVWVGAKPLLPPGQCIVGHGTASVEVYME